MKRKTLRVLIAGALLYAALLAILILSERAYVAPTEEASKGVTTPFGAIWYTLTTLTTVGYGDIYPLSPVGRVIGMVFMLLSVGLLTAIIGSILLRLRTHILPWLRLRRGKDAEWFLFDAYTPENAAIAANLKAERSDSLCIFSGAAPADVGAVPEGLRVLLPLPELLKLRGSRGKTTVFVASGSGMENYQKAVTLVESGHPVCCMSDYEPEQIPDGLTLFDPRQCCARLYWKQHPVRSMEERIVLIGAGKYAAALLEQAILNNVYTPDQHLTYVLYGGADAFRERHPCLVEYLDELRIDGRRDRLLFREKPWYAESDILRAADRVILCEDEEAANLEALSAIQRFVPIGGELHVRASGRFEGVKTFGGAAEVFTPELVLRRQLSRTAVALHERYLAGGGKAPAWNRLGSFLRRSNLAAADHMEVKARVLLKQYAGEIDKERYRKAYQTYLSEKSARTEEFRRIEHERWMRFYLLYNWRYAAKRDNALRLHPLLQPFDLLSKDDQAKDDHAWEQLGVCE